MTVQPLSSVEEAQARRERIKAGLETLWDDIKAAWRCRDWLALGYATWDEMCTAEYRLGLALPAEERPSVVSELRQEGMSTRAIAAATGVSYDTVQRDLKSGDRNLSPEPVTGTDGKTYRPTQPVRPERPLADVIDITEPEVLTSDDWMKREGHREESWQPENRPHVANNSGNNEWYTPSDILDAARATFAAFDCCPETQDDCWDECKCPPITTDPASSHEAQSRVGAKHFHTIQDDGLDQEWRGNVWLNPPYSGDLVGRFIDKLLAEYEAGNIQAAIVLVNNATETGWAQRLLSRAEAVCFPRGRIRYLTPDGEPANTPLQGQMLVYLDRRDDDGELGFATWANDKGRVEAYPRWNEFANAFTGIGTVTVMP